MPDVFNGCGKYCTNAFGTHYRSHIAAEALWKLAVSFLSELQCGDIYGACYQRIVVKSTEAMSKTDNKSCPVNLFVGPLITLMVVPHLIKMEITSETLDLQLRLNLN